MDPLLHLRFAKATQVNVYDKTNDIACCSEQETMKVSKYMLIRVEHEKVSQPRDHEHISYDQLVSWYPGSGVLLDCIDS